MNKNFFFFFFLFSFIHLSSAEVCVWQTSTHTYNFTTAQKIGSNYQYYDLDEQIRYFINLCGPLGSISPNQCPCCNTSNNFTGITYNQTDCVNWGSFSNSEIWNHIDPDVVSVGVNLTYEILDGSQNVIRSMQYNMFCNEKETFEIISAFEYLESTPPYIQINVATYLSCLEPTPSPEPSPTPDPTLCKTIFGNEFFDLTKLKSEYYYYNYIQNDTYFLTICQNYDEDPSCPCCIPNTSPGWRLDLFGFCHQLGDLNHSSYMYLTGSTDINDGISLEYQFIDPQNQSSHNLRYDFICDPDSGIGEIVEINEDISATPPITEVTFVSQYGCYFYPFPPTPTPCYTWPPCPTISPCPTETPIPTSSSSGLKGGYVFLSVSLVGAATFIGGWFFHRFKKDKRNQTYKAI